MPRVHCCLRADKGRGNEATGRQRIWRWLKNEDNTRDFDTMSLHAFTANAYDDILNALVHVEVMLKSLQQVITVASGTFGELVTSRQGQGKYRKKRCTGLFVCLVTRAKGLEIAFDHKTTCSSFMTVFFKMENHRELTKEMSLDRFDKCKTETRIVQIAIRWNAYRCIDSKQESKLVS